MLCFRFRLYQLLFAQWDALLLLNLTCSLTIIIIIKTSIEPTMITYFFIILKCSFVGPIEIQIIHNIFSCRQIHYIYLEWSTIATAVARTRHPILLTFFNAYHSQWAMRFRWDLARLQSGASCAWFLCFVYCHCVVYLSICWNFISYVRNVNNLHLK